MIDTTSSRSASMSLPPALRALALALALAACEADEPLAEDATTRPDTLTTGATDATSTQDTATTATTSTDTATSTSDTTTTTAPPDTVVADTTVVDTSVADTSVADTNVTDTTTHDTTTVADTSAGDTSVGADTSAPIVDNGLNASWIGGACTSAASCSHPAFNEPELCETSGFPNGYCTQACRQSTSTGAWICPDADVSAATAYTTTRCITADGAPRCAAECDLTKSESGCRPGYACVLRQRHGQPDKIFPVCLPEPDQVWPGEAPRGDDIGLSCVGPTDCEHLACMGLPGGYCTKTWCDVAGCPDGSTCFGFGAGETACLRDCGEDAECREDEGYLCDDDGTCWPDASGGGTWNPAVGAGDCTSAWGTGGSGLSPCDATKDDYVVLRKSARNLALCKSGALVANYRMGLGFAPVGDKQVEGDGKTPEGVFYAAQLVPTSDYYLAFVVSYPDAGDAARGLSAGLITQAQKTAIETAQSQCKLPPQTTALGSWIELHGEGGESDWTLGCAAIDNSAMDVVWAALGLRDTIVILP